MGELKSILLEKSYCQPYTCSAKSQFGLLEASWFADLYPRGWSNVKIIYAWNLESHKMSFDAQ